MRKKIVAENIPVFFIQEGKNFVAYSPAVDLSTCGKTIEQAQKRFHEAFELFIEELIRMGTLDEVLQEHGWKLLSGTNPHWAPPRVIGHFDELIKLPINLNNSYFLTDEGGVAGDDCLQNVEQSDVIFPCFPSQ